MHFQNGKQTQRLRKKEKTKTKTSGFQRGNMGARIIQEVGTNIYTQIYWKSIISKSLWPAEGTPINNVHWSICEKSQIGTVISTSTTESPGCTPQNIQPPKSIILIGKIKIHIKKIKRREELTVSHWGTGDLYSCLKPGPHARSSPKAGLRQWGRGVSKRPLESWLPSNSLDGARGWTFLHQHQA